MYSYVFGQLIFMNLDVSVEYIYILLILFLFKQTVREHSQKYEKVHLENKNIQKKKLCGDAVRLSRED
ncbi:LOW QUALITY PROTEIN: hypothetical protein HZS_4554 [Henneguya salminicola]|nr:LOW QUALITY PROTEIN: hypothetical protein HZS_4554 [Henneguya salminicola]